MGPSKEAVRWPPTRGAYPCVEAEAPTTILSQGRRLYTLSCTADAGPHEAAFQAGGGQESWHVFMHATPQVGMDFDCFLQAVNAVLQSTSTT